MSQAAKSVRTSAAPKHRTGAREKHFIPNYPTKLFIYKHSASKYWWVRYFVNGNAVRKSTKTDSKRDAIAFAKEYFDLITHNQQLGINSTASVTSFQSCLTQLLDAEKAKLERGEISKITYDNNKYRYQKSILPYFRDKEVRDIDYFTVERYLNELSTKNLSSTTVSTYLLLVKKVLEYAARRKLIVAVPQFPKLKVKKVSRGWFNVSEYRTLWSAAQRLAETTIEIRKYEDDSGEKKTQYIDTNSRKPKLGTLMRKVQMTTDMRRLIVFMTNSYIRPSDIKNIKHKHIDIVNRNGYEYLLLNIPPSKGHSTPIVSMPHAVNTYIELLWHHIGMDLISDDAGEDYVFLPQYQNRGYALKQLQRQWEVLMHDTGLATNVTGEERTIYSLRHTAIMYRLIFGDGINTLMLARNARTSVEMIDRFYAKPLTGEMNVGMLQSKKRKRVIYDGGDDDVKNN